MLRRPPADEGERPRAAIARQLELVDDRADRRLDRHRRRAERASSRIAHAHDHVLADAGADGVVCADVLGAGVGEDVVIAYGHAARVAVSELLPDGAKPNVPIDAAVVAIVDRWAVNKQ